MAYFSIFTIPPLPPPTPRFLLYSPLPASYQTSDPLAAVVSGFGRLSQKLQQLYVPGWDRGTGHPREEQRSELCFSFCPRARQRQDLRLKRTRSNLEKLFTLGLSCGSLPASSHRSSTNFSLPPSPLPHLSNAATCLLACPHFPPMPKPTPLRSLAASLLLLYARAPFVFSSKPSRLNRAWSTCSPRGVSLGQEV